MFNSTGDFNNARLPEEIYRRSWPSNSSEAFYQEDSDWEILNENNSTGSKRHWFKQNYIHGAFEEKTSVTYH